jgi:Zn finger protein HypA/HybF involved in hydrogenase expression
MHLDLNCRRCDGPVKVELSDLTTASDRQARWACPRCHASNLVPGHARVVSVEKIQS